MALLTGQVHTVSFLIAAGDSPINGEASLTLTSPSGATLRDSTPVDLGAGESQVYELHATPQEPGQYQYSIVLTDEGGVTLTTITGQVQFDAPGSVAGGGQASALVGLGVIGAVVAAVALMGKKV